MKIDWSPSEKVIKTAKTVYDKHEDRYSLSYIAKEMGMHKTYAQALNQWYIKNIVGKKNE